MNAEDRHRANTVQLRLIDWGLAEFYHQGTEYNVRVSHELRVFTHVLAHPNDIHTRGLGQLARNHYLRGPILYCICILTLA